MDDHTLEKLGFDHIRTVLAGHCSCALGKELARQIRPATNVNQVRRWLDQVRELSAAAETIGLPPMAGIYDLRPLLHQAATPAGLEAEDLAQVAETLAATGPLRRWVEQLNPAWTHLAPFGERLGDFTVVADQIRLAIDDRGKVRDSASDKLASLRAAIYRAQDQIQQVVQRLLRHSRVVRLLQYPSATFHNDRLVLPLKAEHRGRVPGIVHRSSDSGATLFVEPAEAVELNNTIVQLRLDEQKEVSRILQQLSRLVHQNDPEITRTLQAVATLDLIVAKYRYGESHNAVCPQIRDDGVCYLYQARNPVLLDLFARQGNGCQVVPIGLRLGDDFDLLVITGPNTGGKTATLKTIGLITAMVQAGIPIPVGPSSEMPVYRKVFIDVGDEQSLEQSLSTFSAHMSNILSILKRCGRGSLVLIDELGAGTDPDEGAAIGLAVIEELLRRKAKAVVTTHLSALKSVAYTHARADNASVEFDVESLQPTYHLRLGEPGNSHAITVAHRLGMPDDMFHRARKHLASHHHQLQEAIEGTLESRRKAESARLVAIKARFDADQQKAEYEKERQQLAQEQEQYRRWVQWVNHLQPGDRVGVRSFDTEAVVVRMHLHQQKAVVSTGATDIEIPLRELIMPGGQAGRKKG